MKTQLVNEIYDGERYVGIMWDFLGIMSRSVKLGCLLVVTFVLRKGSFTLVLEPV